MQYIKHYWICVQDGNYCCENNPVEKRHPEAEFTGLDVKIWTHDEDGIDICLSQVPDGVSIVDVVSPETGKNFVKVLTEAEYHSVATPYFGSQTLSGEAQQARQVGDEATAEAKETAAAAKLAEATTAIRAL